MVDLEDFSYFQEVEEKLKHNKSLDEIETLKTEFQKKLKEEKEKAFQEGYQKGITEGKSKIEKQLNEQFQKIIEEKENEFKQKFAEIDELKIQLQTFKEEIEKKYNEYLNHINNILLDSISEILEFLYIDPANENFISKIIQDILEEFKNQIDIEITVSPKLSKHLEEIFPNIKIKEDEKIEKGDFVIVFPELQIENKIKDKIDILKNEIKREIKKFT